MPIVVDKSKVMEFILNQVERKNTLPEKELILMIMALEHLRNDEQMKTTINIGVGVATGALTSIFVSMSNPIVFAGGMTVAIAACVKAFRRHGINKHLKKVSEILSGEMLSRYDDVLTAYFMTAQLIQSIERDDLLDFFERCQK